jgi:hypothetical protein
MSKPRLADFSLLRQLGLAQEIISKDSKPHNSLSVTGTTAEATEVVGVSSRKEIIKEWGAERAWGLLGRREGTSWGVFSLYYN